MVLAARDGEDLQGQTALETLCRTYWYPLYAFVRARGYSSHDAEDLTQAFFYRLIEKQGLRHVNPAKGRFRHFLLASMKHFLANEWDRARTLKRGGDHQVVSLAKGRKAAVFEILKESLTPGAATSSYADLGKKLNKNADAVAVEVHRLRARYRDCVRQEIANTVSDPRDVESELVDLLRILGG